MSNITLPSSAWFVTRYGLMVSETSVELISWKRGTFTLIKEFVNDNQGIQDFSQFLKVNAAKFDNKAINICISVIGEDYRFEKVAHLYGKYRSDMLKRRFQQLFRGTTYHTALFQGREAIGRRQDFFLFCGVLSNEKIQPWVREVTRYQMNVAGVHLGSVLLTGVNAHVIADKSGVNVVSLCMNQGFIRHNFYIDGDLRFSRLSRSSESASADEIYRLVRTEIEKTSQYLVSVKLIPNNSKIKVSIVCADDILEAMRETAERTLAERISVVPISARVVGSALGIKKPISEFGRDSSFLVHEMVRSFRFLQLAAFSQIRFYIIESISSVAILAALLWGFYNVTGQGLNAFFSFNQYSAENSQLEIEIAQLSGDYQSLVNEFVQPPSTTENMRASVNVLNHVVNIDVGPGKMLLYLSRQLSAAPAMYINNVTWYVSNDAAGGISELSFANGRQYFEVLEFNGSLSKEIDSEQAFEQYKRIIARIEARPDMQLEILAKPSLVEAGGQLVGKIADDTDLRSQLNAFTDHNFSLRISWDPNFNFDEQKDEGEPGDNA